MTRTLSASVQTALAAEQLRPCLFLSVEFASGTTRLWTGLQSISWDSQTWTGVGDLLSVTPAAETAELRALGFTARLSGIKTAYISLVLGSLQRGLPVKCWFGQLDSAGAVIADPALVFYGRMDAVEMEEGAEQAVITVQAESRLIDLRRPRVRRYTPADQERDYSGDKGFAYVPTLATWEGQWGGGRRAPSKPRPPGNDE